MKPLSILTTIGGIATLVTACSSAAPRAPLGLEKRPANSPDTVARLSARPEPVTIKVPTPTTLVPPAAAPTLATKGGQPLPAKITVSDFNAPGGAASLPESQRRHLLQAATASEQITLYARTDQLTRSPVSTRAAVERGVKWKRYLVSEGVPEGKIRLMYRPAGAFVTPNRTKTERAMNRRVEIVFG